MKKLMLSLAVLLALSGSLHAQDVTGTWQGTLQAGRELRIVIKVSAARSGELQAVMYSIDQGSPAIPANTFILQGTTVKMSVAGIGGTYDGKLSADGTSISGTWTQGTPLPLNLKRATSETAWTIPEAPAPLPMMAADASPTFEVATIKPSNPDRPQGKGIAIRGRQLTTLNTTLDDIIAFAYGFQIKQITGGPAWMETEKFDLAAQPDGVGQPSTAQWKTMLQKLMADRFKLVFHHDKKELAVYAIVVGKDGPKLAKSTADPNGLPGLIFQGLGVLPVRNASLADFANVMQMAVLDRPVVDQTGLAGKFDFTLRWTPDESQFRGMGVNVPPPTNNPADPPGLFTAIQEQLGLKLDSTKAPVDVIVVDRVEKPSAN